MTKMIKRITTAAALVAVLGIGEMSMAQRIRNQDQPQDLNSGFGGGGGRRGRGNQDFGGGGGGRGRRSFGSMQVPEGDYSVIATKSIFLRDRRDRVTPTGPVRIDPATLPPEELLVATGIVFEEGGFHAYIEHLLQQGLVQLKVGDTIREGNREVGEVTEIRMDGFDYRKAGGTDLVTVGVSYNLKGTRVDSIQGERLRLQTLTGGGGGGGFGERQFGGGGGGNLTPGGPTGGGNPGFTGGGFGNRGNSTPAVAPPPLDPSSASLTMEERLRLRRAQEAAGTLPQVPVAVEAPPAEEPAAPAAAAAAPDGAPATPGVDVNSLTNLTPEERMMLRRRQELGE